MNEDVDIFFACETIGAYFCASYVFFLLMKLTLDIASFNCLHENWTFSTSINDFAACADMF